MAAERDFELLDDYLTNRLSAEDKAYVENKLKQDPDLQREYTIQQNIAKALRSARKAELKAMLNAVPIPAGGGSATLAKIIGAGTVALIIGIGAYFYNNSDNTTVNTEPAISPTTPAEEKPAAEDKPSITENTTSESAKATTPIPNPSGSTIKPTPSTTPTKSETSRKPEVYDPTAEIEGGENPTETESGTGEVELPKSEIETEIIQNDKYKFHYQRTGDEVKLYGPFDRSLFTIMDFNDVNTGHRSVFMFYKNNYYILNEDNTVKPLSPVNDPALLKKLRELK